MTHGYRRRIAPVLLARAHRHALCRPTTPGSVPCAPAYTRIGITHLGPVGAVPYHPLPRDDPRAHTCAGGLRHSLVAYRPRRRRGRNRRSCPLLRRPLGAALRRAVEPAPPDS